MSKRKMSNSDEFAQSFEPTTFRIKTHIACTGCRLKKTRCDGQTPCASCREWSTDCVYPSTEHRKPSQTKTDRLLATMERIEQLLQENGNKGVSPQSPSKSIGSHSGVGVEFKPSIPSNIPQSHTSATEQLLNWKVLDRFSCLRYTFQSIFQIEQSRPSVTANLSADPSMSIPQHYANLLVESFQSSANTWYPTLSWRRVCEIMARYFHASRVERSCEGCTAMLIMAIGAGVQSLTQKDFYQTNLSNTLFASAYEMMHLVVAENSAQSICCLFLTAYVLHRYSFLTFSLYFLFLQRPIQAWTYLNMSAMKCQLMLKYSSSECSTEDYESIKRVYWGCFIIESELPQSGLPEMADLVKLPSFGLQTHLELVVSEEATAYFLACISIRRVMNRVHGLLYQDEECMDTDMRGVVQELDHQLDEWYNLLPGRLQFSKDLSTAHNNHQAHLRQRYFACKSTLFRFILQQTVESKCDEVEGYARMACKNCLDACCLHILNVKLLPQTVFVDAWICALAYVMHFLLKFADYSMACNMILVLAAAECPTLRGLFSYDVQELAPHLTVVLERIKNCALDESPSLKQCIETIKDIGAFLNPECGIHSDTLSVKDSY